MRQFLFLCLISGLLLPALASARPKDSKFLTVEEALELAYPECNFERESVFLTKKERKSAEKLAGHKLDSGLLLRYTAMRHKEGEQPKLAGWAYLDTHKVRAKRESLLIVVNPDDSIRRIEVLAFLEPHEYLPRAIWYAQFKGKKLNRDLRINRDIRGVSGATLTGEATLIAVRKILAAHQVSMHPKESKK